MNFFDTINNDIKLAMKSKQTDKLDSLRAIKSEMLLLKTAGNDNIGDDKFVQMLQKMIKQRKQSAEIYKQQGRQDLFDKEMKEVTFIMPYLPKQLTDDELKAKIQEIVESTGASSIKDMGKVIGQANKSLKGQAEGKKIAEIVKKILSVG